MKDVSSRLPVLRCRAAVSGGVQFLSLILASVFGGLASLRFSRRDLVLPIFLFGDSLSVSGQVHRFLACSL